LKDGDFLLYDNGQQRKVTVEPWGTYESRISMVVVVETNAISQAAVVKVRKLASLVDNIIGENGEVAIVTTDVRVEKSQDFTNNWEVLQPAFERLTATGETAGRVLDGLDAAVTMLAQKPEGRRRVILLLSEGHDHGSTAHPLAVLTRAEKENVTIYTVNYSSFLTPFTVKATDLETKGDGKFSLLVAPVFTQLALLARQNPGKAFAVYTGGRQLGFAHEHRLEDDFEEVATEVHSQYQLSFAPVADPKPVYHELKVEVKGHPDALVRARPGYWIGTTVEQTQPQK